MHGRPRLYGAVMNGAQNPDHFKAAQKGDQVDAVYSESRRGRNRSRQGK